MSHGLKAGVVQVVAANGVSDKVSVVHRDVGLLQRGKEVRRLGVNIVVADMFDAGKLYCLWGHPPALLHISKRYKL